jgi:hypothetical protein
MVENGVLKKTKRWEERVRGLAEMVVIFSLFQPKRIQVSLKLASSQVLTTSPSTHTINTPLFKELTHLMHKSKGGFASL